MTKIERESSLGWQLVRNLEKQSDLKRCYKEDMAALRDVQQEIMGQIKSAQTAFDFATADATLIESIVEDTADAVG